MSEAKRVMIIGLDCAPPKILFDDMRGELPVLSGLMERGVWGQLESCDPPITVPAWSCMMTLKDPGTLGFYGFRNREDHSLRRDDVRHRRQDPATTALWDILGRAGKHCVVLGVPQTFPPPHGQRRHGLLLPDAVDRLALHLPAGAEGRDRAGRRRVHDRRPDFRTDDKDRIMRDIQRDDAAPLRSSPATCATRGRGTSS